MKQTKHSLQCLFKIKKLISYTKFMLKTVKQRTSSFQDPKPSQNRKNRKLNLYHNIVHGDNLLTSIRSRKIDNLGESYAYLKISGWQVFPRWSYQWPAGSDGAPVMLRRHSTGGDKFVAVEIKFNNSYLNCIFKKF